MKIKITRACGIDGEMVEAGKVVEVSEKTGRFLIAIGKAKIAEETDLSGNREEPLKARSSRRKAGNVSEGDEE